MQTVVIVNLLTLTAVYSVIDKDVLVDSKVLEDINKSGTVINLTTIISDELIIELKQGFYTELVFIDYENNLIGSIK